MRKFTLLTMGMGIAFMVAAGVSRADPGLYAGASVGESGIKGTVAPDMAFSRSFDESDTGWKAFAGYRFGLLGVEGGYVDFGGPSTGGAEVDLTGWDLFGTLNFDVGPATLFAKAGGINWDSKAKISGVSFSRTDNGTDAAWGLGASFKVAPTVSLRGEYEEFALPNMDGFDTSNVHMWSGGVQFGF